MIEYVLLAQMAMTTENRSLGPGTYEESMAQINGASPPSGGYTKGWQSSAPTPVISSGAGRPIQIQEPVVPEE